MIVKQCVQRVIMAPNTFSCSKCNKHFKSAQGLTRHASQKHQIKIVTALNRQQKLPRTMPGANGGGVRKMPAAPAMSSTRAKGGNDRLLKLLPSHLGSTVEGQKWALKCLHPCGETVGGSYGIPDTTSLQICLPEARGQLVISAPTNPPNTTATWDCVIMFPDVVEVSCVVFTKWASQTWEQVRTNLNSTTPTFTPPVINYYSLFNDTNMTADADSWRVTSSGATTHLNASQIANQGMVYADHWPYEMHARSFPADADHSAWNGTVVAPPTMIPSDMVERSPRCYINNARKGCYAVQLPLQATGALPYYSTGGFGDSGAPAEHVQFLYPDQTDVEAFGLSLRDDKSYAPLKTKAWASARGGFTCSFMVYEGIAQDANIQVKTKESIEMVPTNKTIAQAFTRQSPMLDREALDAVARVAQSSAGAYPADYNDLSKILGSIAGAIRGVAGPVSGIADFISGTGIPIVSDIAGGIRDIFKLFG
jgi:hypothetical protein